MGSLPRSTLFLNDLAADTKAPPKKPADGTNSRRLVSISAGRAAARSSEPIQKMTSKAKSVPNGTVTLARTISRVLLGAWKHRASRRHSGAEGILWAVSMGTAYGNGKVLVSRYGPTALVLQPALRSSL